MADADLILTGGEIVTLDSSVRCTGCCAIATSASPEGLRGPTHLAESIRRVTAFLTRHTLGT